MSMKGFVIAAVAGGMFSTIAAAAFADAPMSPSKVKCVGLNDCKGKGGCRSADNACKGKNGCKGKGWLETTEAECKAKGGTVLPAEAMPPQH